MTPSDAIRLEHRGDDILARRSQIWTFHDPTALADGRWNNRLSPERHEFIVHGIYDTCQIVTIFGNESMNFLRELIREPPRKARARLISVLVVLITKDFYRKSLSHLHLIISLMRMSDRKRFFD